MSDGTVNGTTAIAPIGNDPVPRNPQLLTDVSGTLFFKASTGTGMGLWKATKNGATLIKTFTSNVNSVLNLTNVAGVLFFVGNDGTGSTVWMSDGTPNGTKPVPNAPVLPKGPAPNQLASVNGKLYFGAVNRTGSAVLWTATPTGAQLVTNLPTGWTLADPEKIVAAGNKVFFAAVTTNPTGQSLGNELWVSDATGTHLVKDIYGGEASSIDASALTPVNQMVTLAGKVYFRADDGTNGAQLWVSDGDPANDHTYMIKNLGKNAKPTNLTVFDGKVFFIADDGNGRQLWMTDGTAGGTQLVTTAQGKPINNPTQMTVSGKYLFIATPTGLWEYQSDVKKGKGGALPGAAPSSLRVARARPEFSRSLATTRSVRMIRWMSSLAVGLPFRVTTRSRCRATSASTVS